MLPLATGYLLVCDLLEIAVATGSKKTHEGLSRECGKCDEHVWKFHFITGKQPTGAPCELIRLSFDSRGDLNRSFEGMQFIHSFHFIRFTKPSGFLYDEE